VLILAALLALSASVAQAGLVYVLRADPAGSRIYGYLLNDANGALTALPGFPLATGGAGDGLNRPLLLSYEGANSRLYAYNNLSGTLSAFAVNAVTGAVLPLPYSPFSTGTTAGGCIAVHPAGTPVVLGENAKAFSFNVSASSALAATGSPFAVPSSGSVATCAFDPLGGFVYLGDFSCCSADFSGFGVNATTGALASVPGSPIGSGANTPTSFALDASRLFLTNFSAGQVRAFSRDGNGSLTAASGNPFPSGLAHAHAGIVHPAGFYLVLDALDARLGVYRVAGSGSATTLTPVAGSPFTVPAASPNQFALNSTGRFLVAGRSTSRALSVFRFDPVSGAVHLLSSQAAGSLGASGGLNGLIYAPGRGTVPAAATNLKATALSRRKARLQWQDAATNEAVYQVELRKGGQKFALIRTLPANSKNVTVENLSPGATYTFRLRAQNAAGLSAAKNASLTLPN
jgi:6-phosphogluconolactonase (cycloisomerase 2 family)